MGIGFVEEIDVHVSVCECNSELSGDLDFLRSIDLGVDGELEFGAKFNDTGDGDTIEEGRGRVGEGVVVRCRDVGSYSKVSREVGVDIKVQVNEFDLKPAILQIAREGHIGGEGCVVSRDGDIRRIRVKNSICRKGVFGAERIAGVPCEIPFVNRKSWDVAE